MSDITQEQADAFAGKLQAFQDSLSQDEQDLLACVLAQSALATDEDVTGFSFRAAKPAFNYGGQDFMLRQNSLQLNLRGLQIPLDVMGW